MEKVADNNDNLEKENRIYEVGYLLIPTVSEDKLSEEVSLIKDIITKNKGIVISEEDPKSKPLAYEMSKTISNKITKFNTAYFGWVKFESSPDMILKIENQIDGNPNTLRILVIKTVKEDTLSKAPQVKRKPIRKPQMEADSKGAQISEAEIDKTIDELVVD